MGWLTERWRPLVARVYMVYWVVSPYNAMSYYVIYLLHFSVQGRRHVNYEALFNHWSKEEEIDRKSLAFLYINHGILKS